MADASRPPAPRRPVGALPATVLVDGRAVRLRLLTAEDQAAILAFGQRQPSHDLVFLRRDIRNLADVEDWLREVAAGSITTVLAEEPEGGVLGYASLDRGTLRWTRHVGEIRVLVDAAVRHRGRRRREWRRTWPRFMTSAGRRG